MSEVWDKVYKSENAFFGLDASIFALLCFNHMKMNNVRRILELGAINGKVVTCPLHSARFDITAGKKG